MHKKLQPGYKTMSKELNVAMGAQVNKWALVPDMHDYTNLWLALQLVVAKRSSKDDMSPVKVVATDLIKIFNGNGRWNATEMNIHEASIISSGLALLSIKSEKFVADLGDIIKKNLKEATAQDLILLTKASFYMRNF